MKFPGNLLLMVPFKVSADEIQRRGWLCTTGNLAFHREHLYWSFLNVYFYNYLFFLLANTALLPWQGKAMDVLYRGNFLLSDPQNVRGLVASLCNHNRASEGHTAECARSWGWCVRGLSVMCQSKEDFIYVSFCPFHQGINSRMWWKENPVRQLCGRVGDQSLGPGTGEVGLAPAHG